MQQYRFLEEGEKIEYNDEVFILSSHRFEKVPSHYIGQSVAGIGPYYKIYKRSLTKIKKREG